MKVLTHNELISENLIEMKKMSESIRVGKLKCVLKNSEQF